MVFKYRQITMLNILCIVLTFLSITSFIKKSYLSSSSRQYTHCLWKTMRKRSHPKQRPCNYPIKAHSAKLLLFESVTINYYFPCLRSSLQRKSFTQIHYNCILLETFFTWPQGCSLQKRRENCFVGGNKSTVAKRKWQLFIHTCNWN